MTKKIICVTSYPEKGKIHSSKIVGVATYTKNLLNFFHNKYQKWDITVFAELMENKEEKYVEDGVFVKRLWKRNSPISVLSLFKNVYKENGDIVLLSFEAYLFGNIAISFIGILSLLTLRIFGKKTVILLHQVIDDFSPITKSQLKASLLNLLSKIFYLFVKLSASKIIVFEESLKSKLGSGGKIEVVPHLVFDVHKLEKKFARKKLGLEMDKIYVLYFGYITPYKGVDWLVKNWVGSDDIKLIVGGGANPNHKDDVIIQKYIQKVEDLSKKKDIFVTGFIAEEDIPLYFSACDAVILPYKLFMSSSGPLAFAFAFEQPVILSRPLSEYTNTSDFKEALLSSNLEKDDVVFDFSKSDLMNKVERISKKKKSYIGFARKMKKVRRGEQIAENLHDVLVHL